MASKSADFRGQAFMEMLRPPKGMTTRLALFATYSADPIVLGGCLLNLHGRGRDDGSGNPADFADAIEALKGKARFVVQRGRIHRGRKLPRIAAVLDRFVVQMPYRESEQCWHPKIALVCYDGPKEMRTWRLWVGSRNLTTSRDMDLGLLLDGESRRRKGSRLVPGIPELGAELARVAEIEGVAAAALESELATVRWLAPDGIDVSQLRLRFPGDSRDFPFVEAERRKIVVLSPFLCDRFASALARTTAACTDRKLVTTLQAVRKLGGKAKADLAGFKILALGKPVPDGDPEDIKSPTENSTDEAPRTAEYGSGLHAKIFAAIDGERVELVAGSANATDRAWSGANAEAIVRFEGGADIVAGLAAIVGSAIPLSADILETCETETDAAEERLERLRWQISELPFALRRDGVHFEIRCEPGPKLPAGAKLEIGVATMARHWWKRGAISLDLGSVPLAYQTDLLEFGLSLGADVPPARWLQRVPVTPEFDSERDSAAIARFLSLRDLQSWLREALHPDAAYGVEDSWEEEDRERGEGRHSWKHDGFALEDILSAWARQDHSKLKRADAMLSRYTTAMLAHGEHLSENDRRELEALGSTWSVVREVLLV